MPELLGVMSEMVAKDDLQQVFELGRNEEPLDDWKGDRKATLSLVSDTRQRELFGVGGGDEEVVKSTTAVSVATSQAIRLVDGIVTDRTDFSVLEPVLGPEDIR